MWSHLYVIVKLVYIFVQVISMTNESISGPQCPCSAVHLYAGTRAGNICAQTFWYSKHHLATNLQGAQKLGG